MSIPKYRAVRYTDDGCELYQCLNCYRSWEARTEPNYNGWSFCPCCGVKWEGRNECRKQGTPKWVYELEKTGQNAFSITNARLKRKTRGWVIQIKFDERWYDRYVENGCYPCSLVDVVDHLLTLREWEKDKTIQEEYRALIKDFENLLSLSYINSSNEKTLLKAWKQYEPQQNSNWEKHF